MSAPLTRKPPQVLAEPNWLLVTREAKKRQCLPEVLRLVALLQEGSIVDLKSDRWMSFVDSDASELQACLQLWRIASPEISPQALSGATRFSNTEEEALREFGINPYRFTKVICRYRTLLIAHQCSTDGWGEWSDLHLCLLAGMLDLVFAKIPARQPTYQNADGLVVNLPRECMAGAPPLLMGVPLRLQPLEEGREGKKILAFATDVTPEDIDRLVPGALQTQLCPPVFDQSLGAVVSHLGRVLIVGGTVLQIAKAIGEPTLVTDPQVCAPVLAQAILDGKWHQGRAVNNANVRKIDAAAKVWKSHGTLLGIKDRQGLRAFYERTLRRLEVSAFLQIVRPRELELPSFSAKSVRRLVADGVEASMLMPCADLDELMRLDTETRLAEQLAARLRAHTEEAARNAELESLEPELRRIVSYLLTTSEVFEGTSVTIAEEFSVHALVSENGLRIGDQAEALKLCRKPNIGFPHLWKVANEHGPCRTLVDFALTKGGKVSIFVEQRGGGLQLTAYLKR